MPDVEAIAAPSAAEVIVSEPIEIPRSNTPEYAEWRKSGVLPQSSEAKTVEPPATDAPKAETAVDPDPAAGKQQESRRKPDAEARIAELTAKAKQLEKDLEEARKPKEAKADPPPARQPERKVNPEPTPEDKNDDGTPKYKSYEEFTKALGRHVALEILAEREAEQAQAKQKEAFDKNVSEARSRYEDFDSKAMPVVNAIFAQGTPQVVIDALNDSPVVHDLLYAIGGDEASMADFLKKAKESPSKAMRMIVLMEQPIMAELSKSTQEATSTDRDDKGKFIAREQTPAKRGPESAPNPPLEIGNRGGIPKEADPSDTGDFRAFMRQRNAEDLKRQRGA